MTISRRPLQLSERAAVLLAVQAVGFYVAVPDSSLTSAPRSVLALAGPAVSLAAWFWLPRLFAYLVAGSQVGLAVAGAWLVSSWNWSLGQLVVLAMPVITLVMLAAVRFGRLAPAKPFAAGLAIAVAVLSLDGFGRFWFNPGEIAQTPGLCEPDPLLGWRLRPLNGWKTFYPANPRSYFDLEPSDGLLDPRLWLRDQSTAAKLRLIPPSARDGTYQVTFVEDTGPSPWTFLLRQQFWPVTAGDELLLEFEARAEPDRALEIVLPISSEPARNNGLATTARVRSAWKRHEFRVRLPVSDDDARLIIACGGPAGEFALRNARATINGAAPAQDPARRFSVFHQTNTQGYRWPRDYALDAAGATRIAVLGDSFTFGWGVRVEDTLGVTLERTLAELPRPDSQVEVLNFAVPGYNTPQHRLCFEQVARAYHPRIVLLLMVFNDNEPLPDLSGRKAADRTIWSKVFSGWLHQAGVHSAYDDYRVCCDELANLADACRAADAELVLVAFRNDDFPRWMALVDTVSAWANQRQIRFLDLGPGIQSLLDSNWESGWVYDGFHPNEHVHRHAGETLAKYLIEQRLLD